MRCIIFEIKALKSNHGDGARESQAQHAHNGCQNEADPTSCRILLRSHSHSQSQSHAHAQAQAQAHAHAQQLNPGSRPRSRQPAETQSGIIQSRFLQIYGLLCLGSWMACIKTIGASIEQQTLAEADPEAQDKDKDRDKEREAETETGTDTEAETETDARIMATGICIIRLITLKRFLEDSTTDEHNQRRQPSTATSAASAGAAGASAAASQPRRRPTHYPGSSSAPPAVHPEATLLLLLLLLTSLWPEGCECLHGGSNTVKTKYGLLRGIVVRSSPLVEAFLGIPYASPPVGSLR